MMIGQVIQAEIIKYKQKVQFKIPQLKNDKEIDQQMIKAFLKEVDLDLQYYTNLNLLYQLSLEYNRLMGNNLIFNQENVQMWIQSKELIDLTYALRWVYEISSENDREQINIVFDPNDQTLKKLVLLNIGLEQKKEISPSNLLEIVCDNSEILYGLSLYIQKMIDTIDIQAQVPLLNAMIQNCDKTAINQLIIIELVEKVLSKFYEQNNESLKQLILTDKIIQQIEWQEDYKNFTQQELENPNLSLRKTKQLYRYTKDQYEMIKNKFKSQWEEQLNCIITSSRLQLENENQDTVAMEDMFRNFDQIQDQEVEQQSINNGRRVRPRFRNIVQIVPQQPQEIPRQINHQANANPPPPPPPPPLPSLLPPPPPILRTATTLQSSATDQSSIYIKYSYPILENNIDETIWNANLKDYQIQINEEVLKLFQKKEKKENTTIAPTIKTNKEVVVYGNSVFNNVREIELKRKVLEKINLDKVFEQVNQLEFVDKNQDKQIRTDIELLNTTIQFINDANIKQIELNIKKAKKDSAEYRKSKLEEEDQLLKKEVERFKSLSNEERESELLKLDENLNVLENDLQPILKEQDIQHNLSELELMLEQIRNNLKITQLEETKKEILLQLQSALLEKQKLLKYQMFNYQDKFQINPNDSFLKYLYDRNTRKGIQIEAFYQEHVDRKIDIENIVTQYREVLEELKKDVELILYFKYIQQYGKVFNNVKVDLFGYKFENIINFTYKTQQLEGNQEELIKYIVERMIDQGIAFKDLKETPFKHLENLSNSNKALSEIKTIIQLYQDHEKFLNAHLLALSKDKKNFNFIEKTNKYLVQYGEFIFQMDTINKNDQQAYIYIRNFFCDDRKDVESPKFFQDILTIKKLLRTQYDDIQVQKNQIQAKKNQILYEEKKKQNKLAQSQKTEL